MTEQSGAKGKSAGAKSAGTIRVPRPKERRSWEQNPATRILPSAKVYDRRRSKQKKSEPEVQ